MLYIYLIISFPWYKEYMIWHISFSKFSDVLSAFTPARSIGNLWSICAGVKILSCLRSETLPKVLRNLFPFVYFGNISPSTAVKTFWLPFRSIYAFLRSAFFSLTSLFAFADSLKISKLSFNLICCSNASSSNNSLL